MSYYAAHPPRACLTRWELEQRECEPVRKARYEGANMAGGIEEIRALVRRKNAIDRCMPSPYRFPEVEPDDG
jgi:hypothetical protein